jgi:Dynamin family
MGFQFNHVGGGTKTRRPIALHMKYNGACTEPKCSLLNEQGVHQPVSLQDLRAHIEAENQRLNAEGQFLNKDIVIKIEYKFCPNLTIIDTPGARTSTRYSVLDNKGKPGSPGSRSKLAVAHCGRTPSRCDISAHCPR